MKFFALLLFAFYAVSLAAASKSKGELRLESRFFQDDGSRTTQDQNFALASSLEGEADTFFENQQIVYRLFARSDQRDQSRSRILVQDLHYKHTESSFQLTAGAHVKNLSMLEAFHPVDIFNARNLDSDLENSEKIGQIGVSGKFFLDNGEIELMLIPVASSPKYPTSSNRLGFGSLGNLIASDIFVNHEGKRKDDDLQIFLRSAFFLDSFDFSLMAARMYDVNLPKFSIVTSGFPNFNPISAHPIYFLSDQLAATFQTSYFSSQIFKFEAIYKTYTADTVEAVNGVAVLDAQGKVLNPANHLTMAIGWEYILNHANGADSNFFVEWQKIDADNPNSLGFFQNDLFLGYRISFNDIDAQELMISLLQDLDETEEYLANIRYGARLNSEWSYRIGVRIFEAKAGTNNLGMGLFRKADHAYLNLSRYF